MFIQLTSILKRKKRRNLLILYVEKIPNENTKNLYFMFYVQKESKNKNYVSGTYYSSANIYKIM